MQITIDLAPVLKHLGGVKASGARDEMLRRLRDSHFVSNRRLADQIEAQLPKPKPEEPTGLGAVVEDAEGRRWVNTGKDVPHNWCLSDDFGASEYAAIDAVRVLSEGVTE